MIRVPVFNVSRLIKTTLIEFEIKPSLPTSKKESTASRFTTIGRLGARGKLLSSKNAAMPVTQAWTIKRQLNWLKTSERLDPELTVSQNC